MSQGQGAPPKGFGSTTCRLNIKILKQWATDTLPYSYYLREVLMMEPDTLSIEEYLVKIPLWLKLYDLDKRAQAN